MNWTQVYSKAAVSKDTATTAATLGSPVVRYARLPRQSNSLGNFALTYDSRRVSARAAWQYQGESITSYGDGSATPSGDNWFLPHSQLDASVTVDLRQRRVAPALGTQSEQRRVRLLQRQQRRRSSAASASTTAAA